MALTPKQEKFAQCVASGMNQSAAYRAAYDCEGTKYESVNQMAWDLMRNVDVASRVEELRIPIEEQVGITLKSYVDDMLALKMDAQGDREHTAAIKALENVGKVLGYYVNKTELTGRGGGPVQHTITREIIDPKEESHE